MKKLESGKCDISQDIMVSGSPGAHYVSDSTDTIFWQGILPRLIAPSAATGAPVCAFLVKYIPDRLLLNSRTT